MLKLPLNKQRGITVIELLVGVTISLIITAFTISGYLALDFHNKSVVKSMQLEFELRHSLSLMTEEIRRAGYWGNAKSGIGGASQNPFTAVGADIQIPSSSCILFTYDASSSGSLPAINNAGGDDRFGYRLSGGALQSRIVPSATFNCASNDWANLTDPKTINISNISFSFNPNPPVSVSADGAGATTSLITVRNVEISITGNLVSDSAIVRTVNQSVRIRNDKFTA